MLSSKVASAGKENTMDEEMNLSELLKKTVEENQTRKILDLIKDCKTVSEAEEKIRALLNN